MNKKAVVALAAVVIGLSLTVARLRAVQLAQQSQPAGYDPNLEEFWRRWEGGKPSEAVRHAAPTPELERAWEPVGRAADEFQTRTGGRCLGHSQIVRKPLGDRMEYVSFYALYDPTPVRVQFLFYCPKDRWTAISLRVDSQPGRWLEEANQQLAPGATVVVEPQGQTQ